MPVRICSPSSHGRSCSRRLGRVGKQLERLFGVADPAADGASSDGAAVRDDNDGGLSGDDDASVSAPVVNVVVLRHGRGRGRLVGGVVRPDAADAVAAVVGARSPPAASSRRPAVSGRAAVCPPDAASGRAPTEQRLPPVQPPPADRLELLAEVLVQEAVDDRVCARGGHAEDVADGVDAAEELLGHGVGVGGAVAQRVQDVEREPADAEDGADPAEQLDRALQAHDVALAALVVPPQDAVAPVREVAAAAAGGLVAVGRGRHRQGRRRAAVHGVVGVPLPHPLLQPQPQRLADLVVGADERDHREEELEQQDEDGVAGPARLGQVLGAGLQVAQPRQDDLLEQAGRADVVVGASRCGSRGAAVRRRRRRGRVGRALEVAHLRVVDEEAGSPAGPVLQGLPDSQGAARRKKRVYFRIRALKPATNTSNYWLVQVLGN